MIKDAFRSLKNDLDRAIFYWFVFVLSSMFMFLFFHLSLSSIIGVTFIHSDNNLATTLTVFVIIICMIVIFLANDFYVKKKSRELAVILVCGGTYLQLVKFLLSQTLFLMLCSIPFGIGIGYLLFPVFGQIMSYFMHTQVILQISSQAMFGTIFIITFEVFWCVFLNLGYTYRNSIKTLIDGETKVKLQTPKFPFEFKITIPHTIYLIIYMGCIILMYLCGDDTSSLLIIGCIGLIGMYGCLVHIIIPYIDKNIQEKWINDPLKIVYMGFLREDLKLMMFYICLLIITAIILLSMFAFGAGNNMEMSLSLLSYAVMNILLSLSLMFRCSTEIAGRKYHFSVLQKIGYLQNQRKMIMKKELLCLYTMIIVLSLLYIVNILIILYVHHYIRLPFCLMIILLFIVPLIISGIINYIYYQNLVESR